MFDKQKTSRQLESASLIRCCKHTRFQMTYCMCLQVIGVIWATVSAGSLLCGQELHRKRSLVLYPLLLLYIYFLSLYTGAWYDTLHLITIVSSVIWLWLAWMLL